MDLEVNNKRIRLFMLACLLGASASTSTCARGDSAKSLEHFRKGKLAYGQRKLALAAGEFAKAAEADGTLLAARIMRGKAEFYQGKFKEAAGTFEGVHDDFPGNAAAHYWLGRTYLQIAGKNKEARKHLLKAVSFNDSYFNAHYYLGVLYERDGKIKEALIEYRRATLIKKDFDRIHRRLAGLYKRAGFPERAAAELGKVRVK